MQARLVGELMGPVVELTPSSRDWSSMAQLCIPLLFSLSVSASGTDVAVRAPAEEVGGAEGVGVLVLGYGGSSVDDLEPIERVYLSLRPSWTVVRAVRPGAPPDGGSPHTPLSASLAAQLERIVAAVDGCASLIVHAMSNNGQMLWSSLLESHREALAGRTKAIVYDCAPSLQAHMPAQPAVVRSIFSACDRMGVSLAPRPATAPATGEIRPSRALERMCELVCDGAGRGEVRLVGTPPIKVGLDEEAQQRMLALEPAAPTLLLTSEEDAVVPADGVREYARSMRRAAPQRRVEVGVLAGQHCRLHLEAGAAGTAAAGARASAAYAARLQEIIKEAGLA